MQHCNNEAVQHRNNEAVQHCKSITLKQDNMAITQQACNEHGII